MLNLANLNGADILLVEHDGIQLIPLQPIAKALNLEIGFLIDFTKSIEMLNDVPFEYKTDTYQGYCLPLMYVLGWIVALRDVIEDMSCLQILDILYGHLNNRRELLNNVEFN